MAVYHLFCLQGDGTNDCPLQVGGRLGWKVPDSPRAFVAHSWQQEEKTISGQRADGTVTHVVVLLWPDVTQRHKGGAEPFLFNSAGAKLARQQLNIQPGHVS